MPATALLSRLRGLSLLVAALCIPSLKAEADTPLPACAASLEPAQVGPLDRPAVELGWGEDEWLTALLVQGTQLVGQTLAEPGGPQGTHRLLPGLLASGPATGRLRVLLVGEAQECDAGELELLPALPPMGWGPALVELQLAELDLLARLHGGDLERLRRPVPDSAPPLERLLGALVRVLDGDGNDRSVRAHLERLSQDDSPEAQRLQAAFEQAVATSGLMERQSERLHSLHRLALALPQGKRPRGEALLDWVFPPAHAMTLDGSVYARALQPDSAETLARMMGQQLDAEIRGKPNVGIYRDLSGMVAQIGFTGINAMSAGRAQRLQQAGDAYNGMIMIWSQVDKLIAGLFPAELARLELEAAPLELRDPGGSMEGAIERASVVPRSKGVDLGKLALGLLLQSQQWVPLKPVASTVGSRITAAGGQAASRALDVLQRAGVSVDTAAVGAAITGLRQQLGSRIPEQTAAAVADGGSNAASGATRWVADNLGVSGEAFPDLVKILPFEFAPVSILEPGFFQARSGDPDIVSLGLLQGGTLPYSGLAQGSAELRVETVPGAFPNAQVHASVTVSVERFGALLQPPVAALVPGAWTVFTLSAGDLGPTDFSLRLDKPGARILGQRELPAQTDASGRLQRRYQIDVEAPAQASAFPVRLEVHSVGEQRLLASARLVHPRLVPDRDCIEPGASRSFDVSPPLNGDPIGAAGMRRELLRLELSGAGTLLDWEYSAPAGKRGQTARLVLRTTKGEELDRLDLRIGCACRWKATVGGSELRGDIAQFTEYRGLDAAMQMLLMTDTEARGVGFIQLRDETLVPGASIRFRTVCRREEPLTTDYVTGGAGFGDLRNNVTHAAGMDGFLSCPDDHPEERDAPPPSPLLTITHLDEEWVEGRLEGEFFSLRLGQMRPARSPASVEFRARRSRLDMAALSALAGSGLEAQLNAAGPEAGMATAQLLAAVGAGNYCDTASDEEAEGD